MAPWFLPERQEGVLGGGSHLRRSDVVARLEAKLLPALAALLATDPALAARPSGASASPLHVAATHGLDASAAALLEAGADPLATWKGVTPLDIAARRGEVGVLKTLAGALDKADPKARAIAARLRSDAELRGFSVTPAEVADAFAGWPARRRRRAAAPPPAGGTPRHSGESDEERRERRGTDGARARDGDRPPADDGDATCAEGGGWAIDADVPRTCDLDVVDAADLTPEAFVRDYASVSRPVLVRGAMPLRDRCAFLGRGARDVADGARNKSRCGATAYPWMTQQDACGVFSMDDLANGPAPVCANGVKPVCVAQAGAPEALIGEPVLRNLPEAFKGPKTAAPLPVLRDAFVFWRHVQLFAGGDDAGATVHFHDAAYNLLVFGTKKWYLAPPADNAVSAKPTRAWVDAGGPKFECDQGPGDLMLVPEGWAHATKNAGPAMGIGVLYLQADRLVAGEACNPPDKADEAARADSWRALLGEGVRPKPTRQTKMKGGLLGIADQAEQRGRGAGFSVSDLCDVHGYGATAGNATTPGVPPAVPSAVPPAVASTPGGDRVAARPVDASHKTHNKNATTPPRPADASRAARGVDRARSFARPACVAARRSRAAVVEGWAAPGAHATTLVLAATVPRAAVAEPLRGTGDNDDVDLIYVANQKAGSTTFAKDLGRVLGANVDARCACLGDQCAAWDGRTCSRHRAKGPVAPARGDAVAFTFVHDPVHVFWAGVRQAVCNERRPEEKGRNSTFLRLPRDDRPSDAGVAALLDDMAAGRYLGEPLCGNQIFNPTSM